MRERTMLKIGEFARMGQVSIATLRHYDQCGLLKPNELDPDTGYRYYSLDQLERLNRILAFKELGFPLEQVAHLLEENLSMEQLRGMFTLKQAQTQQLIDTESTRLVRIAARLSYIEQEGKMPAYEVLLKRVDPLLVASIRDRIPDISERSYLYETLTAYLDRHGVQRSQPDMLLLHSRHELHDDEMSIDVEVAIPLPTALPGNEQIHIRTLPGGLVASTVHMGPDLFLGRAYLTLYRWMKDNGYHFTNPPRHVHLQRAGDMDSGHYVTEVQFPVGKSEG
jgi:DNA-binding transcriptional MerR regulator